MVTRVRPRPRIGGACALATADLHLAANPRDSYRFKFLEETLPALVQEHDVASVLVLGDLCEAKDAHRSVLVNRIVDGFAAIARDVDVYVLKGNHDYVVEDVPFYRFLNHLPRIHWINEPTTLQIDGLGRCFFLPHTRTPADDWVDLPWDPEYDWYFCHQTFGGADLGHGYRADGAKASSFFPRGARVISGDVHTAQDLGQVTYVGAPYHVDFGDEGGPRVVLLDKDGMESIPVPGPQKRLVRVTGEWGDRSMKDHQKMFGMLAPGDVVKVAVELPAGSDTPHAAVRTAVRSWAEGEGVRLYAVQVTQKQGGGAQTRKLRERTARSDEEVLRAYAGSRGQGKATVAAGLKYLEE